jgi:hypothetical protein
VHGAPVKEHSEFVSWLYSRGEEDSCHALMVGKSDHGRLSLRTTTSASSFLELML